MRVQAANDAALGAPSRAPSLDRFKTPKNWGCGMVFKLHSCFLERMLAMLRYPMRSSVPAANGAWNPPGPLA